MVKLFESGMGFTHPLLASFRCNWADICTVSIGFYRTPPSESPGALHPTKGSLTWMCLLWRVPFLGWL